MDLSEIQVNLEAHVIISAKTYEKSDLKKPRIPFTTDTVLVEMDL